MYISLCKTFENGMGGQSKSFNREQQYVFGHSPTINQGPSDLGIKVIKKLLSTEEGGRRIFIDIQHMSVEFRKWYFKYLERLRILGTSDIPVIASHAGISGLSWGNSLYLKEMKAIKIMVI